MRDIRIFFSKSDIENGWNGKYFSSFDATRYGHGVAKKTIILSCHSSTALGYCCFGTLPLSLGDPTFLLFYNNCVFVIYFSKCSLVSTTREKNIINYHHQIY